MDRVTATPLAELTWQQLDDDRPGPVLVVPVGACEQHGPHLPLSTDTIIAEALAGRLVSDLGAHGHRGLVAPPLAITASGEHQGFPGTLSIGTDVLREVVVEMVRSAGWAMGVVLVNGHGGNHDAVTAAAAQLTTEGRRVLAWWPSVQGGDPHAGHVETSVMLALRPDLVHLDRAVTGPVPRISALRERGVLPLSPTGVLGDPTRADASAGRVILDQLSRDLADAVARWMGPGSGRA